jgi:predicted acyltransferase
MNAIKPPRYYSLDVFRGATVALMILVNNPGTWSAMFSPLEHVEWHGCTPTDLVFPFFLFAVGNAMAFVIPLFKQQPQQEFWKKVIKRTILIFAIGLFINWWPFLKWENNELIFKTWQSGDTGIRIMGVLQRIAIAYFFASIIAFYFKEKMVLWISVAILILYWILTKYSGGIDPYSMEGFIGTKIDNQILGLAHIYKGEKIPFDPEGIYSTITTIPHVLFGYLIGVFINIQGNIKWLNKSLPETNQPNFRLVAGLFVLGTISLVIGYFWQLDFPLNKKIWSSSYVFHTTGLAILTIATMIWFIEILKIKNGLMKFFDVFGKNPLFIFAFSGLFPRLLGLIRINAGFDDKGEIKYISPLGWFYENICAKIPGIPEIGSFAYSLIFLAFFWALAYWLDQKKIYIKV